MSEISLADIKIQNGAAIELDCLLMPTDGHPEDAMYTVAAATYAGEQSNEDSNEKSKSEPVINVTMLRDGTVRAVAMIDSVGSQVNRFEEALDSLFEDDESIPYPRSGVRTEEGGILISTLKLPHRHNDAWIKSAYKASGKENEHRRLNQVPVGGRYEDDLTPLYQHFPLELVTGTWDSYGQSNARLPRAIVSRIEGYAEYPAENFTKRDIKSMAEQARELVKMTTKAQKTDPIIDGKAFVTEDVNGSGKIKKSSELGFGSVPSSRTNLVSVQSIRQQTVLSLNAIRRLKFPDAQGHRSRERDLAAQQVVLALAVMGIIAMHERQGFLRSGCDLVLAGPIAVNMIKHDGTRQAIALPSLDSAILAYKSAYKHAKSMGLAYNEETNQKIIGPEAGVLARLLDKSKTKAIRDADVTAHQANSDAVKKERASAEKAAKTPAKKIEKDKKV